MEELYQINQQTKEEKMSQNDRYLINGLENLKDFVQGSLSLQNDFTAVDSVEINRLYNFKHNLRYIRDELTNLMENYEELKKTESED